MNTASHVLSLKKKNATSIWGRLFTFAALCCFLVIAAPFNGNALDEGQGTYVFKDPETAKEIPVWFYKPKNFTADSPVVVALPGLSRNAKSACAAWKKSAEQHGLMVLVPDFSKELFPGGAYPLGNYYAVTPAKAKKDGTKPVINPKKEWSFSVPDKVFADFGGAREKTAQKSYYLFGHSTGSQFIHRMLLLYPEAKVKLAIAANASLYTLPDLQEEWSYGVKGVATEKHIEKYLARPFVVMAGEKDTDPESPGLSHSKKSDQQGLTRLERAKYFFAYGADLAKKMDVPFAWRLEIVPGAPHSNQAMVPAAAALIAQDVKEK